MQKSWTDKEIRFAKKMRFSRIPEPKMAEILGRSRGSIQALFRRHELPSSKPVLNKISIPPNVLNERDRRANEPRAGGGMMGEPPFSQSALGRRT